MKNEGVCKGCKYRAWKYDVGGCNYLCVTGKSRYVIEAKLGIADDDSQCVCYEKGARIKVVNFGNHQIRLKESETDNEY